MLLFYCIKSEMDHEVMHGFNDRANSIKKRVVSRLVFIYLRIFIDIAMTHFLSVDIFCIFYFIKLIINIAASSNVGVKQNGTQ